MEQSFADIAKSAVTNCTNCHLHNLHNGPVPGQLNHKGGIVFLGQSPGMEEDAAKAPFVGVSGRFLRAVIRESGFDSRYLSFVNMISCRPPRQRKADAPTDYELAACRANVLMQINSVAPRVIVSLGKFAAKVFTDTIELRYDVGRVFFPRPDLAQVPLYHPSFVLRNKKEQEGRFKQHMRDAYNISLAPSRYLPETCRRCKRPVYRYDEMALAYCKYCYTKVKKVTIQEGML